VGGVVAEPADASPEVVARLRQMCLGLPEAYEERAWVGLRWRIRTHTFAHVLTVEAGWPPAYAQAAARKLSGTSYMRAPLAQVATIEFLPVCLQRGYLKAAFGDSQARVVTESEGEVEVDAILPLTPGKIYSTSAVQWKGNAVFASNDLEPLIHLPVGQPADAVHLNRDLEKVAAFYHTKGYMTARITPKAVLDDEHSTVRYDLNVVEGDQFKMGELEIIGLDSQAKARLVAAWKLPEGDPYNTEYPRRFLNEQSRLIPAAIPWEIGIHEAVNDRDKTVDVTIRFSSK